MSSTVTNSPLFSLRHLRRTTERLPYIPGNNQMFFLFILVSVGLVFPGFQTCTSVNPFEVSSQKLAEAPCPFNIDALANFLGSPIPGFYDLTEECQLIISTIHVLQSEYLRTTGFFLPPPNASQSCSRAFQAHVNRLGPDVPVRSFCGFEANWIYEGCKNITSRAQFERLVPESSLHDLRRSCNHSLKDSAACASCTKSLSILRESYLTRPEIGNSTTCSALPSIYVGAVVNPFGPLHEESFWCLFFNGTSWERYSKRRVRRKGLVVGVVVGCGIGLLGLVLGIWFLWKRGLKWRRMKKVFIIEKSSVSGSGLQLISERTNLVRFTFEEIKHATDNFSRENMIGRGCYGNVYKGILLADGSEVAVKRFKNCSAAGDENFAHEVEVIASVRHVNLVALRGYCTTSTPLEGHQRMIVCDLMKNGSLYDHLFGSGQTKLSWPIRQKIAVGMARGLAYLHCGAQPGIIHRDIKASNLLLDEKFEAKLADFGLAKFTPEGTSHLSTKVAGTLGYVAPEYALYGQLTEKSDVYSFGVVLLELLSERKALVHVNENETSLVTDWAWSLVREGRALEVIEEGMGEMGEPEVMEKYVLVAVLASHPHPCVRPTIDQIAKILETDLQVSSIPECPLPLVAEIVDIEKLLRSWGSGNPSALLKLES